MNKKEKKDKKDSISFKEKLKIYKRAMKDIHKISPGYMAGRCAVQFFNALEQFIPIYLSGLIIDGISGGKPVNEIIITMIIMLAAGFLLQSSGECFHKLLTADEHKLKYYMDMMVSEKIINMDYNKIEDSAVQRENDKIESYNHRYGGILFQVSEVISIIFYGICTVIGALITTADLYATSSELSGENAWLINLSIPVVIAVIIVLMIIENAVESKKFKKKQDMWRSDDYAQPRRTFINLLYQYAEPYQTGKDILLYRQQGFIIKRAMELESKFFGELEKLDRMYLKTGFINQILWLIRTLAVYGFVGFRAIAGAVSAGGVIKDVQSFTKVWWGINRVSLEFTFLKELAFPLKTVYDFLDMPDEKYMGTIPTEKRDDNEYEFEFKNVWFKYPGSEQYVLKDINLKWRIGEKMALVGRNGCGKSTLVRLLCRLYDPTEGEITLNGIDIKKYEYSEYMALFSVVFQDSKVFSFSVAENVAASDEFDRELVEECVVRAGMGERLREMENGIDTCLYKNFDKKGVEISGGEAQKLCLARAVYKGAPFIVLDEPTAALDPVSEHDIYTKFNGIVGTRTAIYISHRLSSCRFCDEITVMDGGTIAERGSHEELIERNEVYGKLWAAQAEYYKDSAADLFA